jgi:hypothetical protein
VLFWISTWLSVGYIPRRDSEKTQIKIDTGKCLISVISSVKRIRSLLDLLKGTPYHSPFFCNCVVPDLVENFWAQSWRKTLKGLFVHLENACPHGSSRSCEWIERCRARIVPQPAYSPDWASSDFFLFEYLKTKWRDLRSRAGRS